MPEAVIVATARTPIGRAFKGSFATERPEDLAVAAIQAAVAAVPPLDPREVEDIILGCGVPGGLQGSNLARVIAVQLGWDTVPGLTVSRFCASSLQSIRSAAHAIRSGEGDVFIAAGVESISSFALTDVDNLPGSRSPRFEEAAARSRHRAETAEPWTDPRLDWQLPDVYIQMGQTAENVASLSGISRHDQDQFALRSQTLAAAADARGFWAEEVTPYRRADGKVISADDSPRPGTTLDGLGALQPAFRPGGTVTAGNSCPLNDGAAALVIMSDRRAQQLGIQPLARILGTSVSATSPEIMGTGPVSAIRTLLQRLGMSVADFDEVEINEAFAVQVLSNVRDLGIDPGRVNVNGGSLALGHPYGMTGARIATTLVHSLRVHDRQFGLEAMCVAGGQGMALALERLR
ncbi:acetyl-CoA C-acetyltransferase [Cryobacterium sp. TMT1-21]|uniref:Acetyl-CoA C-acetyltransferase n=1 Tax=Cryobacterium shii TaxID=1259235 RepID=A0AAQ2HFD5_9MICO|nr:MULTISPECIES: acetyl-CoA C-acetyltransferase [Cryobacterium]TFC44690.1 acetyl-CoA C-acetyltransferase [Cryobacterium shii]TFC88140.1 acetyl-CoA C-acetyltransferase [Cryobacterium sp. TmT2-59]TFD11720.1 acetyl-CoA C-acetyltransferase [Cryobacterium sp. TMT4-10]TFD14580.1 acetyl-CoA C-acetyltransferase [Cryobacterium sp. TMT1-21]TFD41664.1 acetyl-CoA C-acetyltransferase [Cryobacterium sp. TMT2-10]